MKRARESKKYEKKNHGKIAIIKMFEGESIRASCKCLFVNDEWYLTGSSSISIIDILFSGWSFSRTDWIY